MSQLRFPAFAYDFERFLVDSYRTCGKEFPAVAESEKRLCGQRQRIRGGEEAWSNGLKRISAMRHARLQLLERGPVDFP